MIPYPFDRRHPPLKPKGAWCKTIFILLPAVILLSIMTLLVACSRSYLEPYRTVLPGTIPNPECEDKTENRTPERGPGYDLHFVEFDDQGWLHSPPDSIPHNCDAYKQLDFLMESLNKRMREKPASRLSIILYIHGWKHNARYDDENVVRFRSVLQDIAHLEQALGKQTAREQPPGPGPRTIVGIYVGWRGRSSEVLENLTFWTRKAAALRVAQGSTRELLARLRGFQRRYNAHDANCQVNPAMPSMRPDCPIRLLLIGHSFGAWVLYSATSGWLIQATAAAMDVTGTPAERDQQASVERFADLVVLLNPAFEGSRYEPLHRMAQCPLAPGQRVTSCQPRPYYQPPVLVTVTSESDWATKCAFPLGRHLNSLFEPTASATQKEAITHTPGHINRYITHVLAAAADPCQAQEYHPEEAGREAAAEKNYTAEEETEAAFFNTDTRRAVPGRYVLEDGWQRPFCGGALLTHLKEKGDPNALVWNVRANASIMDGHNDITKPALISFIRQLYHELTHPLAGSNREATPNRSEPTPAVATMTGMAAPSRATDSEDQRSFLSECFLPW